MLEYRTFGTLAGSLIAALVNFSINQLAHAQSSYPDSMVFDFSFQSGVYSLDLDGDGINDIVTIGYISGGSGYAQFDFNFLIDRGEQQPSQQRYLTVIPDSESRNNFVTLQNADCVLKSIRLLKIGENLDDWKLLIMERASVPEAGYTESRVEFRILKLRTANSAGFPRFSYRQAGNAHSEDSYCNANDAFDNEWDSVMSELEESLK